MNKSEKELVDSIFEERARCKEPIQSHFKIPSQRAMKLNLLRDDR
jgi:hypothetical protein